MREARAELLGRIDAARIVACVIGCERAGEEVACIVDGSYIAPSWRALDGGVQVWDSAWAEDDNPDSPWDTEAYVYGLDAGLELLPPDFGMLWWDEGCLMWAWSGYDHDENF